MRPRLATIKLISSLFGCKKSYVTRSLNPFQWIPTWTDKIDMKSKIKQKLKCTRHSFIRPLTIESIGWRVCDGKKLVKFVLISQNTDLAHWTQKWIPLKYKLTMFFVCVVSQICKYLEILQRNSTLGDQSSFSLNWNRQQTNTETNSFIGEVTYLVINFLFG